MVFLSCHFTDEESQEIAVVFPDLDMVTSGINDKVLFQNNERAVLIDRQRYSLFTVGFIFSPILFPYIIIR